MTLRIKLLLSFSLFIAALLGLGIWSAMRLSAMGENSRLIIANNYESLIAAQEMKESLERQDSDTLFIFVNQRERALKLLPQHRQQFDAAYEKAARNITEPGEAAIIETLRRRRAEYYSKVDAFLANRPTIADSGQYFSTLEPVFNQLRADCDQLLKINQEAMLSKSDSAQAAARRWFQLTIALAGGLVLAGIILALLLAGLIVRPVRELTETAAKIAGGNLNARATIPSRDELGILAAEFNRMAERVQQVRQSDIGRLLIAQQTTEAAIDSLAEPVLVTDADGRVSKLNRAAARVFNLPTHTPATGGKLEDLVGNNRIPVAVMEALNKQQTVSAETFGSTVSIVVNDVEHAFRLRTNPMRDEEGVLLGAVVLLEDVTHLKEVDKLKSDFINTSAFQLRKPLNDLQMGIHVMLGETAGELNDNQRDVLFTCRDDSEKLEKIIIDLVHLSRIESGEELPVIESVNADQFFRRIDEKLRPQVESRDLTFRMEINQSPNNLQMDPRQVEKVLSELISNAIRCTPRGGEISVRAATRDQYLMISVSDTGRGIPAEYLPNIFARFTRIPEAPSGGTGLGLAICKRLIEAQGGQISVQSESGRGSIFTLTLPQSQG
ncbi:MAG: HAMP domain-containing protein [Acidobacteria bacterium]|nr:HAMP domain-containing protein [Acidobacteriota bacterium]